MLYLDSFVDTFNFDYNTTNDIFRVIYDLVVPISTSNRNPNSYFTQIILIVLNNIYWHTSTTILTVVQVILLTSTATYCKLAMWWQVQTNISQQGAIVRFSAGPVLL
jgi:hypothetical protein